MPTADRDEVVEGSDGTDTGADVGESDAASAKDGGPGVGAPLKVVAVGASAGGLEPLERLFASLPPDTGCAFIVVQHLSPNFRSMMDELLARHTGMRIRRLESGMTLERDCIHLNTPRSVATLRGSRVELETIAHQTMANRPIDALLHSLAEEHGEHALAIVLSGTGSDGRRGCERIAERGGTVLAQSPPDARFDSMPRAVIDAGLADATAPADRLGEQVIRWVEGRPPHDVDAGVEENDDPYRKILGVLRTRYGTDFLNYKSGTVLRRMRRRADMRGVPDLERYARLLRRDADELDELYGDLLIEVTSFFRDTGAFERVAETAMPELVRCSGGGRPRGSGCRAARAERSPTRSRSCSPRPPPRPACRSRRRSSRPTSTAARSSGRPSDATRSRACSTSRTIASIAISSGAGTRSGSATRCVARSCSARTTSCATRRSRASISSAAGTS